MFQIKPHVQYHMFVFICRQGHFSIETNIKLNLIPTGAFKTFHMMKFGGHGNTTCALSRHTHIRHMCDAHIILIPSN